MFGLGPFLDWFLGTRQAAISAPGFISSDAMVNGQSGEIVTNAAQTVAAVYAAVHAYADTISTIDFGPCDVNEEEFTPMKDHPYWPILHDTMNLEQTSQQAIAYAITSLMLRGNSYLQILKTAGGKLLELPTLDPDTVTPKREDGRIFYDLKNDEPLNPNEIIHVHLNYSKQRLRGISPVAFAQTTIGLGIALDNFGLSYFTRGAQPRVILEHPGNLTEKQAKDIVDGFNGSQAGMENANKTGILYGGVKLNKLSVPPEESQFLETRKFSVNEIARWFNLPPSRIGGERSSGTYANIEQDQLAFILHSIRPVCKMFEQEFNRKLLTAQERKTVTMRFNLDSLIAQLGAGGKTEAPAVDVNSVGIAVRAGLITPTQEDERTIRNALLMPDMSPEAVEAWEEDGGVRRPITLNSEDPSPASPQPKQPAPDMENSDA